MSDYRIEIKVKNNNILKMIQSKGYKTVGEFCRLNELIKTDNGRIGDLVNLKKSPLDSQGNFRPFVYRIADVLGCLPDNLFSDVQLETALETNKRTLEVNEAEMRFMLENQPDQRLLEDIVDDSKRDKILNEVLDKLTSREEKIIKMRFGLGEYDLMSTEQIAKEFEVSRHRIIQIQAKALIKLSHFAGSKTLKGLWE